MSLDNELREVLTVQADRREGPAPDIAALQAGGLARRRRRRRRVLLGSSGLAALLVVLVGVGVAVGLPDVRTTVEPAGPPAGVGVAAVPWCVTDMRDSQHILGEGPPCAPGATAQEECTWHHAGTTILTRDGTIFWVADGGLTPLGTGDGEVSMSHDGRLAVVLSTGRSNCGVLPLTVYEVATGSEVAVTEVETSCGHLAGVDDRGRVYVTVADDRPGVLDVRMFDTGSRQWTRVSDVPWRQGVITYVTADGFAVQIAEDVVSRPDFRASIPIASLEGRVDPEGRFVPRREVPIGRGRWSPDRSLVADQQPEGVVVRSADLTRRLGLDLPADLFAARVERLPEVDLLWESPTSLLAVSGLRAGLSRTGATSAPAPANGSTGSGSPH